MLKCPFQHLITLVQNFIDMHSNRLTQLYENPRHQEDEGAKLLVHQKA